MSWLVFAFCGPVLWAISVHLDKYLVERYFKDADVIVLLIFTALMGVVLMPIIAWFEPDVFQRDWASIGLMIAVGPALHGRHRVLSARAAGPRGVDGGAVLPEPAAVRLRAGVSRAGRDAIGERNSPAAR